MLIFAFAPAIAALFSWIFLGEALTFLEMAGMAITLIGIAWVVMAPEQHTSERARSSYGLAYCSLWAERSAKLSASLQQSSASPKARCHKKPTSSGLWPLRRAFGCSP